MVKAFIILEYYKIYFKKIYREKVVYKTKESKKLIFYKKIWDVNELLLA